MTKNVERRGQVAMKKQGKRRLWEKIKGYWQLLTGFKVQWQQHNAPYNYLLLKVDWIISLLVFGASAEDYFIYRFYEKSMRKRTTYVTAVKSIFLIRHINLLAQDERKLVEDKTLFASKFYPFIQREILSSENLSKDNFLNFLTAKERLIIKPADGCNGNGIYILSKSDDEIKKIDAYASFKYSKYVIEEVLEQDGWLKELNPGTLNTVRVNIFNKDGDYKIMNAILRSGQGDTVTDNICAGGVVSWIDIESGIVTSEFCDLKNKHVLKHPLTGSIIIGKRIPLWENIKTTAIEAAKMISNVKYTSWDIAVIKDNRIAIVEGNTYGNFNIQQVITQEGVYKQYKEMI